MPEMVEVSSLVRKYVIGIRHGKAAAHRENWQQLLASLAGITVLHSASDYVHFSAEPGAVPAVKAQLGEDFIIEEVHGRGPLGTRP